MWGMGQPQHYSRDIARRSMRLVDDLWPIVLKNEYGGDFGGPLTTTLLMALATPMLVLPFERIVLQGNGDPRIPSYANDADLDKELTVRLQKGLSGKFCSQPFFQEGSWSVIETNDEYFNIADRLPEPVASTLAADHAFAFAAQMDTTSILACLRNALSHGGVAYLDANGYTTDGPVAMLAFVSARMRGEGDGRHAIGLRIARISEANFRAFLRAWVNWLNDG